MMLCCLALPCSGVANPLRIPEPGYLVIDDVWYGYGVRQGNQTTQATLTPLASRGFHLQTVLELGSCTRSSGLPQSALSQGQAAFSATDSPATELLDPPLGSPALLPPAETSPAKLLLASCQGVTVMFLSSVDGDLSCQMRLGFPFARRSACPSLNASDRSYVHYADFE